MAASPLRRSSRSLQFGLFAILFAYWLLWSGHFTTFLIGAGVLSCAGVVALAKRMKLVDEEGTPVHLALPSMRYLPWLMVEIAKANVDVVKRVLSPELSISPSLFEVEASQKTDIGLVFFANSITLTPGTVSILVKGDKILVHALSREAADGLLEGEMDKRVTQMEGNA